MKFVLDMFFSSSTCLRENSFLHFVACSTIMQFPEQQMKPLSYQGSFCIIVYGQCDMHLEDFSVGGGTNSS